MPEMTVNDHAQIVLDEIGILLNSKPVSSNTARASYLKQRLKDSGTKYYDEPYLRFKGTKYEQETFFVKDPNENILEIKTLTANPE